MLTEPAAIWLLRHGQSQGNVVRDAARGRDVDVLDIADRDMDVPLSELGERQADAFGRWLATQPASNRPDVVVSSPYVRAVDTATRVLAAARHRLEGAPGRAASRNASSASWTC